MPVDNYAAKIWTKKANFPTTARHRTTSFSIGNKGYVGLGHYNSGPEGNVLFEDFWEYDPASDSWTQIANYGGGKIYHAADFVYDGKAYVCSGRNPLAQLTTDLWQYDPTTNVWTEKDPLPSYPRRGAVGFTLGDYGFVGCGQLQGAPTYLGNDFYAYHVPTETWYTMPSMPGPARTSSCAFVIGDNAYVGTGSAPSASLDFYSYNLSTGWSVKANVGVTPRVEAYGFAIQGKGYILCGASWSSGINYEDMWEYDPDLDTWTQIDDFPALGRRYLDGFEINDKAYMGMGTNGTNFKDLWQFNPAAVLETDELSVDIDVYPNPASEFLKVDIDQYEGATMSVFSLSGSLIEQIKISSPTTLVDLSDYSNGTYIWNLTTTNNQTITDKFIVSK